jgi:hypothetical protein
MFHRVVGLVKRKPGASIDRAPAGDVEEAEHFPGKKNFNSLPGFKIRGNRSA